MALNDSPRDGSSSSPPPARLAARLGALPPAPQSVQRVRRAHVVVPLRTAHLRLRLVTQADLPGLLIHWDEPAARRGLAEGRDINLDFVSRLVAASQEMAEQHDGGLWLATRLDDGSFVGACGLLRLSPHNPLELLLTVEPSAWGRGYATELGQRLLRYAFDELHVAQVLADVNGASPSVQRLAERLGMRAERRASWPGTQFYFIDRKMRAQAGHPRVDWPESQAAPLSAGPWNPERCE